MTTRLRAARPTRAFNVEGILCLPIQGSDREPHLASGQ